MWTLAQYNQHVVHCSLDNLLPESKKINTLYEQYAETLLIKSGAIRVHGNQSVSKS